jgi:transcriptional regulator with PAS, ATPase and Fis domain
MSVVGTFLEMPSNEEAPNLKDQTLGKTASLLQDEIIVSSLQHLDYGNVNSLTKDEGPSTYHPNKNGMPFCVGISRNTNTGTLDHLYCREKEINSLKEAYKFVNEKRQSRVLLIRGETGSGKSTLASFLKGHHKLHKEQQKQFGGSCFGYLLQSKF